MRRVAVPLALSFSEPPSEQEVILRGPTMGVTWVLTALLPPALPAAHVSREVQGCLDRIVAQMSTWEPSSEVSRFNAADAGTWLPLAPETHQVLHCALNFARGSDGAFDPTVGQLVELWGFGSAGPVASPPSAEIIADSLGAVGWYKLRVDSAGACLLQPGGVRLDFSGIAKGFGVDEAARVLKQLGVDNFLLDIGGELHGAGVKANGEPWWVMVETPPGIDLADGPIVIALHDLSVATSGSYRRSATFDGRSYSHTIDPRTGRPVPSGTTSVTVLHQQCMHADALCTLLMVLGVEAGFQFAAASGVAAYFLAMTAGGVDERISPAFAEMLI